MNLNFKRIRKETIRTPETKDKIIEYSKMSQEAILAEIKKLEEKEATKNLMIEIISILDGFEDFRDDSYSFKLID